MHKICNEYEICNMQREGPAGRAGFESMFIDWTPPPLIPDWLSNVLPPSIKKLHVLKRESSQLKLEKEGSLMQQYKAPPTFLLVLALLR
jgi:hypothetical protein